MSLATGLVSFARSLRSHPFLNEGRALTKFEALTWLLLNAETAEKFDSVDGVTVLVRRGGVLVSLERLAELWGWPKQRVRRFLRLTLPETDVDIEVSLYGDIAHCHFIKYADFNPEPVDDFLAGILPKPKKKRKDVRIKEFFDFSRRLARVQSEQIVINFARDGATVRRLLNNFDEFRLRRLWELYLASPLDGYLKRNGRSICHFGSHRVIEKLNARMNRLDAEERRLSRESKASASPETCSREPAAEPLVYEVIDDAPLGDPDGRGVYCHNGNLFVYVRNTYGEPEAFFTQLSCPDCAAKE